MSTSTQESSNRSEIKKRLAKPNPFNAMTECVFSLNIMLCILERLPVKSLIRFKSVCKLWLELFTTPIIFEMHHLQFSDDPENQNSMIHSLSKTCSRTMSLFRIMSDEKNPTDIKHPYPEIFSRMDFVGCYMGLICMACPPLGECIILWNPAMMLWKFVRLSKVDFGASELVSLGFGYDKVSDFKVVRIVCLAGAGREMKVAAEVYSAKANSWKTIKVGGLQFRVVSTKNDAIVGGDPHWVAKVDKNVSHIVWFDVKRMVFKMLPSSNLDLEGAEAGVLPFMEWKGSLATIRYSEGCMHVWVFDKAEKIWTMKHVFGPVEMEISRCLQCSKSGKIMGVRLDGKLFVYDPVTGGVKVTEVEEAEMLSFQVYEYTESLVCFNGMESMKVKKNESLCCFFETLAAITLEGSTSIGL